VVTDAKDSVDVLRLAFVLNAINPTSVRPELALRDSSEADALTLLSPAMTVTHAHRTPAIQRLDVFSQTFLLHALRLTNASSPLAIVRPDVSRQPKFALLRILVMPQDAIPQLDVR